VTRVVTSRLSADLIGELVDAGSREHYTDAALYDYEYRRRRADVAFYRELATRRLPEGAHILELGAGSGRVTVALARAGFHVTAVDSSGPMLAKLRERLATLPRRVAERVTVVEADLRSFKVAARARFPLAIAVFNVLEHLYTRVELDACLRCVRAHLAPGGAFAFDVQLPDLAWLLRDPWTRWARTKFTDPTTGRQMIYSTNHEYDPISQIVLIRLYYELAGAEGDGPIKIVKLSQRKFFPAELEALVAHAGFRTIERYGDFGWRPLEPGAESQVLVCEPQTSGSGGPERPARDETPKKRRPSASPRRAPSKGTKRARLSTRAR
jgi:SAM-dependent methyltransferase